jgi:hypothetical protein
VSRRIFIEGGAPGQPGSADFNANCREAFGRFFEAAGVPPGRFRVQMCGGRSATAKEYSHFSTANDLLLLDSEEPLQVNDPWKHLADRQGDKIVRPVGRKPHHCHLMVTCIECWFLADQKLLDSRFGRIRAEARNVELVSRQEAKTRLDEGRRKASGGKLGYLKGKDQVPSLKTLNPVEVQRKSAQARRLIEELKRI